VRVLFVASEGLPFSKTGGLADVVEALPKALMQQGHEVAVVLPRYRGAQNEPAVLPSILPSITVPMGGKLRFPSIAGGTMVHGVKYFFVEDVEYFDRDGIYGTSAGDFPDNAERYAELCRAAIEVAKHVWPADVIHCHDWQTGLLPVLLRTSHSDDPLVKDLPVIFTIHNMGYQGVFGRDVIERAGIPPRTFHPGGVEYFGNVNYLKAGIVYSDYLTTVSRKYAQEIQTPEFGYGLDGVARGRTERLVGILNGVDYAAWSPDTDTFIAEKYSLQDLHGKHACKSDLMQVFGIAPEHAARPIVGIVSRFADQKGFDLIAERAPELLREELSLVVLGSGDGRYEQLFQTLAAAHPGRVGARIAYDNALAHKIEAGSDMFLMPSRYEPCGLNQIYSLKYGTVPIVRATGGLDDTIETFDLEHGTGTGFKFVEYSGAAMMYAVRQALHHFVDERIWKRIQLNGMAKDFSWNAPAAEYGKLYELAWSRRHPGERLPQVKEPPPQSAPTAARSAERNQKSSRTSN
jgi:starch synthase